MIYFILISTLCAAVESCSDSSQCKDKLACFSVSGPAFTLTPIIAADQKTGGCYNMEGHYDFPEGHKCYNRGSCTGDDLECFVITDTVLRFNDQSRKEVGLCWRDKKVPEGGDCNSNQMCANANQKCYFRSYTQIFEVPANTGTRGACVTLGSVPAGNYCGDSEMCTAGTKCYSTTDLHVISNSEQTLGKCLSVNSVASGAFCGDTDMCQKGLKCYTDAGHEVATGEKMEGKCLATAPSPALAATTTTMATQTDLPVPPRRMPLPISSPTFLPKCSTDADCSSVTNGKCLTLNTNQGYCGNGDVGDLQPIDLSTVNSSSSDSGRQLLISFYDDLVALLSESVDGRLGYDMAPFASGAYNLDRPVAIDDFNPVWPPISSETTSRFVTIWPWVSATVYTDGAKGVVIAFKGTNNAQEWFTNFDSAMIKCSAGMLGDGDCGMVHEGFYNAYDALKYKIINVVRNFCLQRQCNIAITGHSLGGAMAVIAGMDLLSLKYPVTSIVTFGAPRIGNQGFENYFADIVGRPNIYNMVVKTARFVAVTPLFKFRDGVTEIPPKLPGTYVDPIKKMYAVGSPAACYTAVDCAISLHFMDSSYVPALQNKKNN